MAAEEILNLFDQNWFFSKHKEPLSLLPQRSNPDSVGIQESEDAEKPRGSKIPGDEYEEEEEEEAFTAADVRVGRRSMSDQSLKKSLFGSKDDVFSPTSVLNVKVKTQMGKLKTILSGKEVSEFLAEDDRPKPERVKKKEERRQEVGRTRRRKSLSDLEHEELKGFMDLGFVFSEEDHKDSDLVSILPGLQELGRKHRDDITDGAREEEEEEEEEGKKRRNRVRRPYLSEAWEIRGERKEKIPMKMKLPTPPENELDMKDHLRLWAHTVAASTFR